MKKISILIPLAAMILGFSSCKQEDEPQFHVPTTFTVNTPALQNVEFETATDMTDPSTFNLFCSQPDYGYAAICNYSALVSLKEDCPEEEAIEIQSTNPTSASMSIKTYELGVAACKLAGAIDEDTFASSDLAKGSVPLYFRAVCSIPGIENSRIVSDNVVSYNKVKVLFTVKSPAWIYICGNVANVDRTNEMSFLAPSSANEDEYKKDFALYEPAELIGEKVYVGQFYIVPKSDSPDVTNVDDTSQFRFFTALGGWSTEYSLGSNEADFFSLPISDKIEAGYTGDIVYQGLGNWGIWISDYTPVTIVVDETALKVYIKEGFHNVSFVGHNPSFD